MINAENEQITIKINQSMIQTSKINLLRIKRVNGKKNTKKRRALKSEYSGYDSRSQSKRRASSKNKPISGVKKKKRHPTFVVPRFATTKFNAI